MRYDIDIITERVRSSFPDVKIEQLKVKHAGVDDDGLWSFARESKKEEIQLESSTYDLPFLVESSSASVTVTTIEEAVQVVSAFLSAS